MTPSGGPARSRWSRFVSWLSPATKKVSFPMPESQPPQPDTPETQAAATIKWALRRLDYYTVARLREALAVLDKDAQQAVLEAIFRDKRRRATGK